VFVYGHKAGAKNPFYEEAYSAVVNEFGALLVMTNPVSTGDTLLVTNKATHEEQKCRVAYVEDHQPPNVNVGVEFVNVARDFWRLTSSPAPEAETSVASKMWRRRPR